MKRTALSLIVISLLFAAPVSAQQSERIEWPDDTREFEWAFVLSRMFAPEWAFTTAEQDIESRKRDEESWRWIRQISRIRERAAAKLRGDVPESQEDPEPTPDDEGLGPDSIIHQIESVVVIGGYDSAPDLEDPWAAFARSIQPVEGIEVSLVERQHVSGQEIARFIEADIQDLIDNSNIKPVFYDRVRVVAPTELFQDRWTIDDHDGWLDDLRSDYEQGTESSGNSGDGTGDGNTDLPVGEFFFDHENRGAPDYSWDQISVLSDAEIRALGDAVVVPAFADWVLRGPNLHFFPFPSAQFSLEPAQQPVVGEWCASPYYVGATGLDVRGQTLTPSDRPTGVGACVWGAPESASGILIMSGDHLADWVAKFTG